MMQRAVERMTKTAMRLQTLAPKLAEAKQTVEFTDERRKMIFSKCVVSFFNAGKISTAEAEHRARSCAEYFDGISGIMLQHGTALEVTEENRALVTLFEASRTVVSLEKSKLNL